MICLLHSLGNLPKPLLYREVHFMKKRKRNVLKKVFYSEEEIDIINKKMQEIGTDNYSAYCRKMTIDGYVIKQDFTDIKKLVYEINKIGTNINQIAKNVNESDSVSRHQIEEVNKKVDDIWRILKSEILKQP